ncbi:AT-rich interactive domain-containing protein 2-like isoform X2 [Cucurbita moschata]|uniref:AT-rich interactive domain-containing protein 2-like isoform X2 n=1 Tax=Cucurbita moschata TaxID=3662 RepID=A0A6J1ETJ6_CUCMO|nr:AT-rich interactive domain-containing protein 2-like isoform X2 [Cucurbita moschata]
MGRWHVSSNASILDCNKDVDPNPSNGCCIASDCLVERSYENVDYDDCKARIRCYFEKILWVFLKEIGRRGFVRPLPALIGEGGALDLFELFLVVRDKGGSQVVSEKKLWSSVVVELGLDLGLSASVKLIYSKYLSDLEKWLMVRCGDTKLENGSSDYCYKKSSPFLSELGAKINGMLYGVPRQNSIYDECFGFKSNKQNGNVNVAAAAAVEKEIKFPEIKKKEHDLHGDVTSIQQDCTETHPIHVIEAEIESLGKYRESLLRMLKWVRKTAKHPEDPLNGTIPGTSRWKGYSSDDALWLQVIRAKDALLIRKGVDKIAEKRLLIQVLRSLAFFFRIESSDHNQRPFLSYIERESYLLLLEPWVSIIISKQHTTTVSLSCVLCDNMMDTKKVKMHPSIYEDNIDNHHLSTERISCSKRSKALTESVLAPCSNSCPTVRSNCISSLTTEVGKGLKNQAVLNGDIPSEMEDDHPNEDSAEETVPVGAVCQADLPEWTGNNSDSDSKWLGTRSWPLQHRNSNSVRDRRAIGRGRPDSCGCQFPGSVECFRFHIAEARMRLKLELGSTFFAWRFHQMGEEISLQWTVEEEKRFKELAMSGFNNHNRCFWDYSLRWFPMKSRKNLISYYFNVFLLRLRSYQNRVTPNSIDSDDEDFEFGRVSGGFGDKAMEILGSNSLECSINRQVTDVE